jgi:hypothetical protein
LLFGPWRVGRQQRVAAFDGQEHRLVNLNMNSAKDTNKKSNRFPAVKSAIETPSPTRIKNGPSNPTIDAKKALAPKPVAPISPPPTSPARPSPTATKANETITPKPFALLAVASAATDSKPETRKASASKPSSAAAKSTVIEAKIDVGFGNTLYLRGQGPGLSWDRGVPCECVDGNTWRWTAPRAEKLTFKLLLNDSVWARGADLVIGPGERVEVVPAF